MNETKMFIVNWIQSYVGHSYQWILFFTCIIIILFNKEAKKIKWPIFFYVVIFTVLYCWPISAKIIMEYCIGDIVYWRMFWLIPSAIIIAYGLTLVCIRWQKRLHTFISIVAVLIAVVISGTFAYGRGGYVFDTNQYKIPNNVVKVCDIIRSQQEDGEVVKILSELEFRCYIRIYEPSFYQPYGRREDDDPGVFAIKSEMDKEVADFEKLTSACRKDNTNYIIYQTQLTSVEQMVKLGYKDIGTVEDYTIWKDVQ